MVETGLINGKKVLIVDDEPDILETAKEFLRMCKVVTASSFQEAKDLLETQHFDIAVLDIMGVDGYALLNICNQNKIPAVMLTAHAFNPPNLVKSIREGAASYVPKEEITRIAEFLNDVFLAKATGKTPWGAWQDRLPSSYFERRWGAAWRDADKEFWASFKASLESRKSSGSGS
ncbi:MAG: response regulator [Deltaproteobacteria bacterium]|nr:response regulator [Deltaproteobacteria bacterium]